MKAWVLDCIGNINYKDIEKPCASASSVIVKVKAAGICGSDIQRVYENGAHSMPLVIGHEFAGVVDSVGENVSNDLIGKRVGIFPLIPCKKCDSCLQKKYEMCTHYSYLGSRIDGGFAEYVEVPEWNLIELPDKVSFEQAAMLEPLAVSIHAIRRLKINNDMTVAISGLGTIGHFIIMLLQDMGIENIYAIGKSEAQKKSVIDMGLTEQQYCDCIESKPVDFINIQTDGKGVDVYFDCVGKNETAALAFEIVTAGGQVCIMGNPYSDMHFDRDSWWKLLRKQITVTGTWNSSYYGVGDEESQNDDWNYVINRISEGRIHPEKMITHKLPIEELEHGLNIMRDKLEPYTKVMVVM